MESEAYHIISIHALVKRATNVVNNYIRVAGISIHALVKRATKPPPLTPRLTIISIHALVKRATGCSLSLKKSCRHFNPRPREEGDFLIHILTNTQKYFNPRPREEGDLCLKYFMLYNIISIHALVKRATCQILDYCVFKSISIHALVKRATSVTVGLGTV